MHYMYTHVCKQLFCRMHSEWNDYIELQLRADVSELHREGYMVLLMGDFNGHVAVGLDDVIQDLDVNGLRLVSLAADNDLTIGNFSDKCKGQWTWMRGLQKSTIDFVLYDNDLEELVQQMIIDEKGERWSIGSDHSWIECTIGWKPVAKSVKRPPPRWAITNLTDWSKYRKELQAALKKWKDTAAPPGGVDTVTAEGVYEELVSSIVQAAENTMQLADTSHQISGCSNPANFKD